MAVKTFTTGEVLTAADTNTYLNNGGLVYITQQTIGSAVSSVTVSNCFSSTYDHYKIILVGGAGSTGSDLKLTVGAAVTGYYFSALYNDYGTTTPKALSSQNGASWTHAGVQTTAALYLEAEVFNPYASDETIVRTSYVSTNTSNAILYGAGFLNNTTSYTSFTITPSGGTMTGGIIYVYGYRKA